MSKSILCALAAGGLLVVATACSSTPRPEPSLAERRGLEHNRLGVAAEEQGDLALAGEEFRLAYRAYASLDHDAGAVTALLNQARVERRAGRTTASLELIEHALTMAPADSHLHAEAVLGKALTLMALNHTEEAAIWAEKAVTGAAADKRGRARNLVARLAWQRGDRVVAHSAAEQALAENQAADDRREEANSWRLLGAVAREAGDNSAATRAYAQALSLDKALGLNVRIGDDLEALAQLAQTAGQDEAALDYLRRAFEVRANSGDPAAASAVLEQAVAQLRRSGRSEAAQALDVQGRALLERARPSANSP